MLKKISENQELPYDLQQLLNKEDCSKLLYEIGCKMVSSYELPELLSHSYLNEEDRKNPCIMANIKAIEDLFKCITFVCQVDDGSILGYWHGPEQIPLLKAPIIQYDTEGTFSILPGNCLTEALLAVCTFDEDMFHKLREKFRNCGIVIKASSYDELDDQNPKTFPDDLHRTLYNRYRK